MEPRAPSKVAHPGTLHSRLLYQNNIINADVKLPLRIHGICASKKTIEKRRQQNPTRCGRLPRSERTLVPTSVEIHPGSSKKYFLTSHHPRIRDYPDLPITEPQTRERPG